MSGREQRISQEAAALWRALHGDAAAPAGLTLQDIIEGKLPEVGYDRLCSPYLRPSTITEPKRRSAG